MTNYADEAGMMEQDLQIMIVEDVVDDYLIVRGHLNDFSKTLWVKTIKEALAITADIDLIILDLMLPDAMEFSGLTKLKKAFPNTPILIHSSKSEQPIIEEAYEHGAHDYILKSDDSTALKYSVQHAFKRMLVKLKAQTVKVELMSATLDEISERLSTVLTSAELLSEEHQSPQVDAIKKNTKHLLQMLYKFEDTK